MDRAIREFVRSRALNRCEYCRLPQSAVEGTFHLEHIVARQHLGADDEMNLALACDRCNFYKGSNLSAIDPETGAVIQLFHPRQQIWEEHFEMDGASIAGRTPTGRETIRLLNMNVHHRQQLRAALQALDEW